MPVVNNKIVAPVNPWVVSRLIGMGSVGCLGTVITKALTGGRLVLTKTDGTKVYSAFDDFGEIIEDAKPYWNPFSTQAPGFWRIKANAISFSLKNYNPKNINTTYWYDISQFEGYDHKAYPISVTVNGSFNNVQNRCTVSASVDMGNYDWNTLKDPDQLSPIVPPIRMALAINNLIFEDQYPYDAENRYTFSAVHSFNGYETMATAEVMFIDANDNTYSFSAKSKKLAGCRKEVPMGGGRPKMIINTSYYPDQDGRLSRVKIAFMAPFPQVGVNYIVGQLTATDPNTGYDVSEVMIDSPRFSLFLNPPGTLIEYETSARSFLQSGQEAAFIPVIDDTNMGVDDYVIYHDVYREPY